jgi:hypothetical protein
VLFTQKRYATASEFLLGGSIFPAVQNFLLAARALGLGACQTAHGGYGIAGGQARKERMGRVGSWVC